MTINHIYNIVIDTMNKLEDIDFISLDKRKYNQQQLNEAYRILDNLKDELIRENIKRRHKWTYMEYTMKKNQSNALE